ncbi:protein draper-like [Gigantopelta aegis]|uniref:protein draper-like n=1 Tax=Gigantopelta aegis TaxID=1735272 RepID=UPI001B889133|nr:protein draper-like [Gigantopelta aegis]
MLTGCVLQHCSVCNGTCLRCREQFFGDHCQKTCGPCKESEICHRVTGVCTRDTSCDVSIPSLWSYNCASWSGQCVDCESGWHGENCTKSCQDCTEDGCNQTTGICNDCKYNAWGKSCALLCPGNCITGNKTESACHRSTGECFDGCKIGWWGVNCTQPCSSGCLNKNCSDRCFNRTCDHDSGKCTNGCIIGYYGDVCNKICSEGCLNKNCRADGTCLEGCKPAFTGKYCSQCAISFYGENCTMRCGAGCANHSCDENGTCRCLPGYTGNSCVSLRHCSNSNDTSLYICIALASLLAVGFLIFIVFRIRAKLQNQHLSNVDDSTRIPLRQPDTETDNKSNTTKMGSSTAVMHLIKNMLSKNQPASRKRTFSV